MNRDSRCSFLGQVIAAVGVGAASGWVGSDPVAREMIHKIMGQQF
jgi:hypothetical protein